jgi:hypothetical protein
LLGNCWTQVAIKYVDAKNGEGEGIGVVSNTTWPCSAELLAFRLREVVPNNFSKRGDSVVFLIEVIL